MSTETADGGPRRVLAPGIVLGVGLGALADGIVLHQILQWHHLLTGSSRGAATVRTYPATTLEALEINILWDGAFHALAWLCSLAGVLWLWRRGAAATRRGWRAILGPLLIGAGAFNVVDGVLNHYVLGIHHVRAGPHERAYDLGFLVLAVLIVAAGAALHRSAWRAAPEEPRRARH